MRAPITDKHLLEMMWERFPEIMKRGTEQPAQQQPVWIDDENRMDWLLWRVKELEHRLAEQPAPGDIRALKHRIHALEGDVIGYKQMLDAAEQQAPVQQEPVAWRIKWPAIRGEYKWLMVDRPLMEKEGFVNKALYTSPQPAQQQEPKLPEFYARFEDGLVSVYQRREDATPLLLLRENLPDKQPAQQEPVAWALSHSRGIEFNSKYPMQSSRDEADRMARQHLGTVTVTPLYTSPPARKPWVGLTDEEREAIANATIRIHGQDWAHATAIEAKLKEKNT